MVHLVYLDQCLAFTAVIFTLLMEQDAVQICPWQMAFEKVYILE